MPAARFALIADARPDKLADVATKLERAGPAMDVSAGHSVGALGQLGSAFTDDGRSVYDPQVHWGALPSGKVTGLAISAADLVLRIEVEFDELIAHW